MKTKIFFSMLVIIFVMAALIGATYAWFSDEASLEPNVFTAGTLTIEAGESWADGHEVENWNPGDCEDKVVTVKVTGSKSAYIRMQFEDGWYEYDEGSDDWVPWVHSQNVDPIKIKSGSDDFPTTDWEEKDGWYYYQGGNNGLLAPGAEITVITEVCLDGPTADNEFQGKQYRIGFIFEAIQTTNYAPYYEWDDELFDGPNND